MDKKMDPAQSSHDDYEGFPGPEKRDAARRQRALMFQWRLLCSGKDGALVAQYGRGEGLSFQAGQLLDDDLRIDKEILTWRQLQEKCGHSLSHFVAAGKHLRVPSIETLTDMAEVGGSDAIAGMLRLREQLTEIELKRLGKSPHLWAKVQSLAPDLLPGDEQVPAASVTAGAEESSENPESIEACVIPLPLPQTEIAGPTSVRRNGYAGWKQALTEGGPLGLEFDTFPTRCLVSRDGSWRNDCSHAPVEQDNSPPAYVNLLAGRLPVDGGDALIRDLRLGAGYGNALRDCLNWWYERRWTATAAQLDFRNVTSRVLDNLFPDHHKGDQIQAGYRLLQSLFFPQHLQDGWGGPLKKNLLAATLISQYYGPSAPPPRTSLKVRVSSLDPPTVYLHVWPSLSSRELLWGRVSRDLWGGLIGYCPKGEGHWFFAQPGQNHCAEPGHWRAGIFITKPDDKDFKPITAFPKLMVDEVVDLRRDPDNFIHGLEKMLRDMGEIDQRFVDPPLAISEADIWGYRNLCGPVPLEYQLEAMKDLLLGLEPHRQGDGNGQGTFYLFEYLPRALEEPEPEVLNHEPPWPDYVQNGGVFPAIRLFSDWQAYPGPPRHAPASLLQVITEAVAAEAIETSVFESSVVLQWGPFWCARPGCSHLFATRRLQRDLRACVAPGGFRSLLFSQYCSHACFIADKIAAKPAQNEHKPLRVLPDVRTFIERGKLLAAGGNR